jgi:hypothetical protein
VHIREVGECFRQPLVGSGHLTSERRQNRVADRVEQGSGQMRLLSQNNLALKQLGPSAISIVEISQVQITETVLAQDELLGQLTEIGLKIAGRRSQKGAHGGCNVRPRRSSLVASALRSLLASVQLSLHMH